MGGKTQKTTTSSAPPQYISDAYKSLIARAEPQANTPYDPATEKQVAGFQAPQTQGFQSVQNAQGIANPYIGQAAQYAQQGSQAFDMNSINQFMNPYQQNVIDTTMAEIGRNNTIQQNSLKGNSVAQGGLGNSRLGVAQAELARNQDAQTANTLAQLNSQNYSQALGAAQSTDAANSARAFQGANAYSGLGTQAQNSAYTDANALLGIGGTQQQQAQNVNDTATANATQRYQQPFNNTSWLAGIESGLAPGAGTTGTQTTPGPSVLGQVAGVGLAAAGLFSDERVKEDIEPVGKTFDGQTVYKYRYKGDPHTQIGLIAQNVEQSHPEAVGAQGGIKTVNYDTATRDAAEKGHFASGGQAGPSDRMSDLVSRVHHAAKGISAIQKATGGRTEEPQGIGTQPGYASGGLSNSDLITTGLGMVASDASNPLTALSMGAQQGLKNHQRNEKLDPSQGLTTAGTALRGMFGGSRNLSGFAAGGLFDDEEDADPLDTFGVSGADPLDPLVLSRTAVAAPQASNIGAPPPSMSGAPAAPEPSGWQGLGVPREQLPAGMRNNNPGNIKYVKGLNYPGVTGPSSNTDEGDPQMVFDNPQHGMDAAARLAYKKYAGGKRSANDIIAGQMGWTPGNYDAADNIARFMGVAPDADLDLSNPERMRAFLKALTLQEHGPSSKLYGDDLYKTASQYLDANGQPVAAPGQSATATEGSQPRAGIGAPSAPVAATPAAKSSGSMWDNVNVPLLAAGLGMLASKSPFAGAAIGEGGLAGVQALMQERKTKSAAAKLADAAKLAQQRLGIQQESLSQRTKQQQDVLEERKRHNLEAEKRSGQAAFSKNVIWGTDADGNPAIIQPGSAGEAALTKLPEGFKLSKDPIKVDLGTEWGIMDPQTRQIVNRIPKNVQEAAQQHAEGDTTGKAVAEAKQKLPNIESTTNRTLALLDRLDKDPMRSSFTGYSGYLPNMSPKANDYQGLLNQVKGNTFLQAFDSLRGAGAITEIEGQAATAALTRLQTVAPSDAGYQSALQDTKKVLGEILKNAKKRAGIEDETTTTPAAPDVSGLKSKYGLE